MSTKCFVRVGVSNLINLFNFVPAITSKYLKMFHLNPVILVFIESSCWVPIKWVPMCYSHFPILFPIILFWPNKPASAKGIIYRLDGGRLPVASVAHGQRHSREGLLWLTDKYCHHSILPSKDNQQAIQGLPEQASARNGENGSLSLNPYKPCQ